LNAEREKLSRRLQDEENKYRDAEKRLGDQLRKSDLIESELDKYRKELENERRRSNVLESEYQNRNKEFQNERDGLLGRLDEEKRNFKKQAGVLGDYTQRLGKSEDLLKEFARQSDLQER
jgi:peptidoglycan hydrolase CwlO-like protein